MTCKDWPQLRRRPHFLSVESAVRLTRKMVLVSFFLIPPIAHSSSSNTGSFALPGASAAAPVVATVNETLIKKTLGPQGLPVTTIGQGRPLNGSDDRSQSLPGDQVLVAVDGPNPVVSETTAVTSLPEKPTSATLPHNLSPWGMFMAADWVVKSVMVGLATASLLTWTILVSKSVELVTLKGRLNCNLSHLNASQTLADAANTPHIEGFGRAFINAARAELKLSADLSSQEGGIEGIKERVASCISRMEIDAARGMMFGTGFLATVGAIGPFVGLLGTVWGIMNSFIGISQANTTNLAVVAPGIAEALLATAFGLVAAIPAVVIYNHFTRQIGGAKSLISDSSAAVMRLVSRDLDRSLIMRNDSQSRLNAVFTGV